MVGFQHLIQKLYPSSPAGKQLSIDDEIIAIDGRKVTENLNALIKDKKELHLTIFRGNLLREVKLINDHQSYFMECEIVQVPSPTLSQRERFENWLKVKW